MRGSLALLCSVVAACGSGTDANGDGIADGVRSPDSVSVVGPSNPVGTLSGQVLYTDFKPLNGVKVSAIVGSATTDSKTFTADTDNAGIWAIKGVPAGTGVQVLFEKEGFATARVNTFIPGSVGNFPVNNGNADLGTVMLTELNGTFKLQVVTSGGQPAKGAKGTLEFTPAAVRNYDSTATYGAQAGVHVTSFEVNDLGFISVDKVPNLSELARLDGRVIVTVAAYDTNMDTRPEYLGTRVDLPARLVFTGMAQQVVILPAARAIGPIRVIGSNVDSMVTGRAADPLRSMINGGSTLYFVFDQAFLVSSVNVKVTDETGLIPIAANKSELAPNILQVTLNGPIESGKEYNIALRATSAENGSTMQRSAYFFGGDPAAPKMFAIEKITYRRPASNTSTQQRLELGDTVVITFNQPIRQLSAQAEVLIEADLNGSSVRGDAQGEKSLTGAMMPNTNGFPITQVEPTAEPNSTFTNLASNYTTRFEFAYNGVGYLNVAIGTVFHVTFSEIPSSLFGYRTLWGTGIELDATAALSAP